MIFTGTALIPPASAVNYVTWGVVGFIFQCVIRRRHFSWWSKYNCEYPPIFDIAHLIDNPHLDVLSAALDSGVACSIVLVFFCLQYPDNGSIGENNVLKWWGNMVFQNTADAKGMPLWTVNGTFGYVPTSVDGYKLLIFFL